MESEGNTGRKENPGRWTSRSIGTKFQHHFFYSLIRIGGQRLAYFFLYFIILYYILFRPSIRKKCYFYLSHRFPDAPSFKMLLLSFRFSLEFGKVLIDRAVIGILGVEGLSIFFEKREYVSDLISKGKGVIFLMAHAGCWQTALSAMSFFKTPVNMVIHREEGDVDRPYFEHQKKKQPYRIIDPEGYLGGTLDMINVLKKGEILCIMGDRVFGNPKNSVSVDFLGEKAAFPFSVFKVASVSGSPVVVILTYKIGATRFGVDMAKIIYVPQNLGRSGDQFKPYVSEFVNILEKYTEDHPFQFFNFYDMWNTN